MAKFDWRGLALLFGGAILLPLACAGDERNFLPAVNGGGSGSPGSNVGGDDSEAGTGASTGGDDGAGGTAPTCTDTLPSGDDCGGTCDPCPDGLSCNEAADCIGEVCLASGECCTPVAEADLCAGSCGTMMNCDQEVTCGDCVGEATCGATNTCDCETRPCAITTASYGDANQQQVRGLAVDSDGNVYILGDFKGTLTFGDEVLTSDGTDWNDIYLVKLDPTGAPAWALRFGDTSDQTGEAIAVDPAGNVVIAKFNAGGAHQFSDQYGDDNTWAYAVTCDPANSDIFVTGQFYGTLKFGDLSTLTSTDLDQAYFELFTVRFSAAGVPQYSRRFGSIYDEVGESIAVGGNYAYVAGTFAETFDFGAPNPTPLTATGWSDMFVARLGKATFTHGWSKRFGDDGENGYAVDTPRIVVDPLTGDAVVAGNFSGKMEFTPELNTTDYEMFLARLNADDGASLWASQFAGAELYAMTLGADGYIYVTGSVGGDVDFGGGTITGTATDDVFLAKFDLDGGHVYSRVFASPTGNQYGEAVAATAAGTSWIAARFDGQLELGTGPLQSQGGYDVAIGKYAP